jgi:hypothetical protein
MMVMEPGMSIVDFLEVLGITETFALEYALAEWFKLAHENNGWHPLQGADTAYCCMPGKSQHFGFQWMN